MSRINEINDNLVVEVFNDYKNSVGYKLDRVSRTWGPNTVKKIKIDELYELVNIKGGRFLLDENMLLIKDSKVREILNLKPLDQYNPDLEKIENLLKESSNADLEEVLQYCSETTLEKIVQKCIDIPIENLTKAKMVHSYSGTDVISIIKEREDESGHVEKIESDGTTTPIRRRKIVE